MANAFFILILLLPLTQAMAAQSKVYWYNVESEKEEKKSKPEAEFPYDSVDYAESKPVFVPLNFWNLRPKVGFSGGFHADKNFFQTGQTNRFFINTQLQFRNRPWHRWVANVQLLQNNTLFLGASWEITPSRKANRFYYGGGVTHRLISEKELGNFVDAENLYLHFQGGREMLLSKNSAWTLELKAMLSSDNQVIQFSLGYLFEI